jgi:hypothetical protein
VGEAVRQRLDGLPLALGQRRVDRQGTVGQRHDEAAAVALEDVDERPALLDEALPEVERAVRRQRAFEAGAVAAQHGVAEGLTRDGLAGARLGVHDEAPDRVDDGRRVFGQRTAAEARAEPQRAPG